MTASSWADDGGLFDGIDVPVESSAVIRTKRSSESDRAHEAWEAWCFETKRPDKGTIDRKFMHAYVEQLRANRDHATLMLAVKGAARLPVKANNANDVRRVLNAIKNPKVRRTAIGMLDSDSEVILYPSEDNVVLLSGTADVADACRVPASEWSERDQEAAGILMTKFTADELEEVAERASRSLHSDAVMPMDVLRFSHSSHRTGKANAVSSSNFRETYSAGITQRERVQGVEFSIDDMANAMLIKGESDKDIVRVHQMAPEGYWDAVFGLAVDGCSNEDAYRRLAPEFDGWHPDQRKK